jgi:predicted NAD-dependent protein-ADP-ribosyltransferase YbiA (DUF1768 family)
MWSFITIVSYYIQHVTVLYFYRTGSVIGFFTQYHHKSMSDMLCFYIMAAQMSLGHTTFSAPSFTEEPDKTGL